MRLRLDLKNPAPLPGVQTQRALERGSMIIGRSQQADWVLPDPERIISKAHCRIERGTQGFILVDMSVNGVMVNGLPINRGIPKQLEDGMTLQVGTALIGVHIEADLAPMPMTPSAASPLIPPAFVPGTAPTPEPKPQTAAAPIAAPIPADFLDGPFGKSAGSPSVNIAQPADDAAAGGPAALQDWWDPAAKPVEAAEADTVIAMPAAGQADIAAPVPGIDIAGLVRSKAGLDAPALAGMVATAAAILPDDERQRLLKRLHELIREASG